MARNKAFHSFILIAIMIVVSLVTMVSLLYGGVMIFTMVYRAMTG